MAGKVIPLKPAIPSKKKRATLEWIETPTGRAIHYLLERCRLGPDMGVICGTPGTGKTAAIRAYKNRAFIATMAPGGAGLAPGLLHICGDLDIHPERDTAFAASEEIQRHFRYMLRRDMPPEERPLLILDEAQYCTDAVLDILRITIFDKCGVGVVLVGNATFLTRFNKAHMASFAQITSRIGMRLDLNAPTSDDAEIVCANLGVADRRAISLLKEQGDAGGGLRTIKKLIASAVDHAGAAAAVTADHIKLAIEMRGVAS